MTSVPKFFTARPRLAAMLMEQGHEGMLAVNSFDPQHPKAWLFTLDDQLADTVTAYYKEQGQPLPHSIRRYNEGRRSA